MTHALRDDWKHVDDFIDDPSSDSYAASWFESYRRPAIDKARKPDERKLFATYEGQRYRVTGCSRLGDVWLSANFDREWGYEKRVNVDDCSGWSSEPHPTTRLPSSGSTEGR